MTWLLRIQKNIILGGYLRLIQTSVPSWVNMGFFRVQGSLYVTENEDMAILFMAIQSLRTKGWFQKSVRDIRAFRIEQWSDFTAVVKS